MSARKAQIERWQGRINGPELPSPFGRTAAGFHDYRGAPLSSLGRVECVTIEGADFSLADLEGLKLTKCTFKECIFDFAILRNVAIRSCEFDSCQFLKTDLRWAGIGISGTLFDRCKFEGVRTARAIFFNAIFRGGVFYGKDWVDVDFEASGFWDCEFRGALRGIAFRGDFLFPRTRELDAAPQKTGLHNVSFEDAELFLVAFSHGCELDRITLPKSGSALLCGVDVLLNCKKELMSGFSEEGARKIEKRFSVLLDDTGRQKGMILSKNDVVHFLGEERGKKLFNDLKDCVQRASRNGQFGQM